MKKEFPGRILEKYILRLPSSMFISTAGVFPGFFLKEVYASE